MLVHSPVLWTILLRGRGLTMGRNGHLTARWTTGTLNCALHSPSSGTNTHIGAYLAVSGHIGGVLFY